MPTFKRSNLTVISMSVWSQHWKVIRETRLWCRMRRPELYKGCYFHAFRRCVLCGDLCCRGAWSPVKYDEKNDSIAMKKNCLSGHLPVWFYQYQLLFLLLLTVLTPTVGVIKRLRKCPPPPSKLRHGGYTANWLGGVCMCGGGGWWLTGGVDGRFSSHRDCADVQPSDSGRHARRRWRSCWCEGCFRGYRKVNFNRLLKQAWLLLPRPLFCLAYMMVVVLDLHVWLSVNNSSVVVQTPKVHKNSCWFHFPAPSSFYFIFFSYVFSTPL